MSIAVPRSPATGVLGFVASVEERIQGLVSTEAAQWRAMASFGGDGAAADVSALFDDLSAATLSGGKRLRHQFCYWGHVGVSRQVDESGVDAAAALELLHAFALIHDDVMDGSATRRGEPALHVRLAEEHTRGGWRGESRRAAEGMAVLVGDLAFTLAHRLVSGIPVAARTIWHELCAELVVGQRLDLHGRAAGLHGMEYAQLVATLKSGRYSVVRPLMLGHAAAGGNERQQAVYEAYGAPLGEAFQLRDDLLGVFGDPEVTGKPVGDDLREGSPTMLLAFARRTADIRDRRTLDLAGRPDLDETDVARIVDVLVRTGAKAETERRVARSVEIAVAALEDASIDAGVRDGLRQIAEKATCRDL